MTITTKLLPLITTLTLLTSCATTRLPDHMIDKTPKYMGKDVRVNADESNLGMPIGSQLISLPMYGALMLLKTPMYLNPQTYKKEALNSTANKDAYFFVSTDNTNNIFFVQTKL